jgi:hypothetical protein
MSQSGKTPEIEQFELLLHMMVWIPEVIPKPGENPQLAAASRQILTEQFESGKRLIEKMEERARASQTTPGAPFDQQAFTQSLLDELETRLNKVDPTKAAREETKRQLDALAKGIPAFANAMRDAVQGFTSGNALVGSAAVVDLCGTLVATVSAMSAAAGPPGAVVAALLSVVSMALKAFQPPQESLLTQLNNAMRGLEAEGKLQGLGTAQKQLAGLRNTLLDSLVETGKPIWTFQTLKIDAIEGNIITAVHDAAEWLEEPNNQHLAQWDAVLAKQCVTYQQIIFARELALASIDPDRDAAVVATDRTMVRSALRSNDPTQLAFLKRIVGVARKRGDIWQIGRFTIGNNNRDSGSLYLRNHTKRSWDEVPCQARVVAIGRKYVDPKATDGTARPYVTAFHLEMDSNESVTPGPGPGYHNRKNTNAYALSGPMPLKKTESWEKLDALAGAYDLSATPGRRPNEIYLYVAHGTAITRYSYAGRHALSKDTSVSFVQGTASTVDSVCAVDNPRPTTSAEALTLEGVQWLAYGGWGRDGRRYISVNYSTGASGFFRAPWDDATGMTTDNQRLWIYKPQKIWCLPHAAIKEALRKMDPMTQALPLTWAQYEVPTVLGEWNAPGYYLGLRDLCACDDGTLYGVFARGDTSLPRIAWCTPTVNDASHFITIQGTKRDSDNRPVLTYGWTDFDDAEPNRVIKQPIFCWSTLVDLTERLERETAGRPGSAAAGASH